MYLDFEKLRATPAQNTPFEYLIVENFIKEEPLQRALKDYPEVPGPGSHPPSELTIKGDFKGLMDELEAPQFRQLVEEKFAIDLTNRPTMYTVRGFCRAKDGSIHTDSETKLITVLLYMNDKWDKDGGRLRLLNDGENLNNYFAEVPPYGGTLLIFKRSTTSWHGHEPYEGKRRAIQLNWVTTQAVVDHEQGRHKLSTRFKKFKQFLFGKAA
jgi:SM-20-related protein